MVSVELRFYELFSFDLWPTNRIQIARFYVQIISKLKTKGIGGLFFAWKVSNPSTPWLMLYLMRFLFFSEFKPTNVLDGVDFSQVIFSSEFVAYQPLQRCQILCTNKQQFEKLQTLVQSLLLGKICTHQCLGWCCDYWKSLFLAKIKPTHVVNEAAFLWDAFSFQFISYQPLNVAKFHAQISTKLKKQRNCFNIHSLKSFKTLYRPQKLIYHLAWRVFSNNLQTTKGLSTGKTLQERFSCDLSDGSHKKVCLHLKFLRKSAFLLCFLPFWKSFWWFSMKFLHQRFSFFKDYTWPRVLSRTIPSHLTIILGLGKFWKKKF